MLYYVRTERKAIKMKFKNRIQYLGYRFGELCTGIGVLSLIIYAMYFGGKVDIIVTKQELIILIVSISLIRYGNYRTGGK